MTSGSPHPLRPVLASSAAAVLLLTVVACEHDTPAASGAGSTTAAQPSTSQPTATSPVAPAEPTTVPVVHTVVLTPRTEYGDALIHGNLVVTDGCINLQLFDQEDADGVSRAVLWPSGTTWDAGLPGLVMPDGGRVRVGGEIEAAGGFHSSSVVRRDYLDGAEQLGGLEECVDDDTIVVLNPLFIDLVDER